MILGNLTIKAYNFTPEAKDESDNLSLGLMIESKEIDKEINQIFRKFSENYLFFIVPLVIALHGVTFLIIFK